ncbi:hypothetical protein WH91_12030 [Devosia psychrophila]|nr:hypothetical protein WH91_12030 [Devosia psychrophila]
MLADIFRQPQVLAEVLARKEEIEGFARTSFAPGTAGRCFVFGSGDGWFAARATLSGSSQAEARSGLDFTLNVAPKLGAADRTVAISMSGNVDRTLEGARLAQQRGSGLAILTNGAGGRLGALGGNRHSLDIADVAPFLCGTSSYVATLATLQLGFTQLAGDDGYAAALAELVQHLPETIASADRFARRIAEQIERPAGIRILGVGESVATADYGAAKFVEVTKIPAWSDDIEEFAHRQYWAMGRQEIVVLLPVHTASAGYADASAEALGDLGVSTIAFEPEGALVPNAKERLTLAGGTRTAAITQAIGLQLLAYHLGIASGTDPNKRLHLKDDTQKFAVSRKLTRRSLLGTGQ